VKLKLPNSLQIGIAATIEAGHTEGINNPQTAARTAIAAWRAVDPRRRACIESPFVSA
jgi:hypothetical protein